MLGKDPIGFWRFQHLGSLILALICSTAVLAAQMDSSEVRNVLWSGCLMLWFWTALTHVPACVQDGYVIDAASSIGSRVYRDDGAEFWVALTAMSLFFWAIFGFIAVFLLIGWHSGP
jgi:hypothetical protein